jgi:hypothetical protein
VFERLVMCQVSAFCLAQPRLVSFVGSFVILFSRFGSRRQSTLFMDFLAMLFLQVFGLFLVVPLMKLFGFFFVEVRATHERISVRTRLRFLVFGFHQARRQSGQLFLAQTGRSVALRFAVSLFVMPFRCGDRCCGFSNMFFATFLRVNRLTCGFIVRQDPVRQASGKPARSTARRLCAEGRPCRRLFKIGLPLLGLMLLDRFNWSLLLACAVFCQRLAR